MTSRKTLSVIFLSLTVLSGCGKSTPEGLFYVKDQWYWSDKGNWDDEKKWYIELKSDGTFFWKGRSQTVGKFQVENGGITLIFEGGKAERWQMREDTLVGNRGTYIRWQKGKSGFEFEQKVDELRSKVEEIYRSAEETNQPPFREHLNLYIKEGFISREQADREFEPIEAVINHFNNLAADAYQYRLRPRTMDGGGGSYIGYQIPRTMASTRMRLIWQGSMITASFFTK